MQFFVSRRMDWLLFADGGRNATEVRRKGAAANCAALKNRRRNVCFMNINVRQPIPRQKRFRTKVGRGDGVLRIGNLLIASKVPQASDSAQTQGRPRNRFTAAVFRLPFVRTKGNV